MKAYVYRKCSTCRKALKWLDEQGCDYKEIDITEQAPTKTELKRMLSVSEYELKELFNRSGQEYRALNMKDRLNTMTIEEAISLLSQNGRLVKRPFIIASDRGTVGFKEADFESVWG